MKDYYSKFGPEPRQPSCMLRSYLLSLSCKIPSITEWCLLLKTTPVYALISGFPVNDTPGIGTFYDFFDRVWQSDSANLFPHEKTPKKKSEKGKKKVWRIYGLFLQGRSPYAIAKLLTSEGIPTPSGKEKWCGAKVKSILQNEKYKGDALLQKRYTADFLTKKKKVNKGEVPQYYVEGRNAPRPIWMRRRSKSCS